MSLKLFSASEILRMLRNGGFNVEGLLRAYEVVSEKLVLGDDVLLSDDDVDYFTRLQNFVLKNKQNQNVAVTLPVAGPSRQEPSTVNTRKRSQGQQSIDSTATSPQALTLVHAGYSNSKRSGQPRASTSGRARVSTTRRSNQSETPMAEQAQQGGLVPSITNRATLDLHAGIGQIQTLPPGGFKHFEVLGEGLKHVKKFELMARSINFKFNDVPESRNPIIWLQNAFDELIGHMTSGAAPDDRVGMVLHSDHFPEKPIGIAFRRMDQLSAKVVMAVLAKILQSNARFFSQDALRLQVDRIALPKGNGRERMTGVSYDEFCRRKRGIMVVDNSDNQCLARALVLAMAFRNEDPLLHILKRGYPIFDQRTQDLCARARVDLSNGGTREHIEQFQQYLVRFTIVVYNHRLGSTVYFEGPRSADRVVLNLILENNHYNVIINLCAAFATKYFCELCRVRLSHKTDHKSCKYICPACHSTPPCNKNMLPVHCLVCNRDFRGQACFTEHTKQLCKALRRCHICHNSVWVDKKVKHSCGYRYCSKCKAEKPIRHLCYMVKNKANQQKLDKDFGFVLYDFETRQDTLMPGTNNIYLHQPNLCVAQNVCKSCIDNDDISQDCIKCGKRQHIFKENPVEELLNYILKIKNAIGNVVALAHNMKGFDGAFILKALVNQSHAWRPNIISTGTKLMSIMCDGVKFIDSLNYMPMPLSKLPKTFNFTGSKGFFPHFFNTLEHQNYNGRMPDIHYYGPDEMSASTRREFLAWYNGEIERGAVFNLQTELVKYCISDVDILRKACVEFWRRFSTSNGVDPFRESCTIAGSCNAVFRRKFLQDETIGLIPPEGYRMADRQSAIAIKWLLWLEHTLDIQIKHAGNSREVRLREGYLVDGFCDATNTVYQFHGCYFHGCETCYPDQTAELGGDKHETMFMRREKTEATAAAIRSHLYTLVEMKECVFRNDLKNDIQAADFLANHAVVRNEPLDPRESFFGGRTNAVKLYHKADDDEQIRYFDVCSLYPFVNKYGKYPVGHPKVHIGHETCSRLSMDTVEGIIKCTVLPPTDLYHPLLPYRMHGKLMFILCRTCAVSMFNGDCVHTQDQRKFTGTYVADELRKAISLGYRVLEILEIWEYKITQYDKVTKTGALFSGYVDTFLKIKQESSGWPSWCTDDQTKDRYLAEYLEREGIVLEKCKICLNHGMRYIAKLCLNCFWGKFGQRENLMQSSIITDANELFSKLTNPSVEAHALTSVNDDTVILNWNRPDDGIGALKTVNVALAAYTTANARLELYKYLEKLDRRVLYFDTDSVIFTQRPDEWVPKTGDFLGDMTDEIECYGAGSKIVEFVSGGPKNYAFKVFSTNQNGYDFVCKVKGITLNYKNSQSVNFDTLKSMILDNAEATYVQTDRKIARTPMYDVVSKPERKIFQVQYTKRRRIEDSFDTLPYGYRV